MKSFPKSKTKGFHSWFRTVSKIVTSLYIQCTNLPKNDSVNSIEREHVLLREGCSKRTSILRGMREVPGNWDFSPFIKEQWIGEKEIPNSNMVYRIVSNSLLWNHLILHLLVACISTLASGWSFPQILFNFCLLDTCITMDSRGLRVRG